MRFEVVACIRDEYDTDRGGTDVLKSSRTAKTGPHRAGKDQLLRRLHAVGVSGENDER